jgi:phospholipid/cholesterol/gamma-HCH transport system ATP-binding protein
MIEATNLNKKFSSKQVLYDINAVFETGKVNMIIGASGGGKTVLLKCLVGLLRPDTGTVSYDGEPFLDMNLHEQRELRQQMGMLFQSAALFDSMTVEENVTFPLTMFTRLSRAEIHDRVQYCLERVNMPNTGKLFPSEISGGMKKRVGIARAIVLNPRYLFFDEPNSGLDPQTSQLIDELIRDITYEYGITSVVVTHDIKSVINIGDHVMFIYKGHKEWYGTRQEILTATNPILRGFIQDSGLLGETSAKKS